MPENRSWIQEVNEEIANLKKRVSDLEKKEEPKKVDIKDLKKVK